MLCSKRKASRGALGRQRQSKSNAASPWQAAVCPPPMCLGVQRHTEGLICCYECQCFLQAWSEQDMTLQQAHLRSCCPPPRRRPCHHQSCLSLCARQMWPAECCTPPGHVGPAGATVEYCAVLGQYRPAECCTRSRRRRCAGRVQNAHALASHKRFAMCCVTSGWAVAHASCKHRARGTLPFQSGHTGCPAGEACAAAIIKSIAGLKYRHRCRIS